ncbi:MAG: hypothetical protein MHM6MM_000691 [Cercozoa sp. M6MM]
MEHCRTGGTVVPPDTSGNGLRGTLAFKQQQNAQFQFGSSASNSTTGMMNGLPSMPNIPGATAQGAATRIASIPGVSVLPNGSINLSGIDNATKKQLLLRCCPDVLRHYRYCQRRIQQQEYRSASAQTPKPLRTYLDKDEQPYIVYLCGAYEEGHEASTSRSSATSGHKNKSEATKNEFEVHARYQVRDVVGQGAYGMVVAAYDHLSQKYVAIKRVELIDHHPIYMLRALRELKFLRMCSHENLIKFVEIMRPPSDYFRERMTRPVRADARGGGTSPVRYLYVVTELMESDLACIIRSPQTLSDDHVQFFIYQVLRGLKYLHSADVLHRDLKPRNLLVNSDCELKLCDFGLARLMSYRQSRDGGCAPTHMTDYVATRWYRAPEVLCTWPRYGKPMDMWAVGCILGELLIRRPIFPGHNTFHQLRIICRLLGKPPANVLCSIPHQQRRDFMMSLDNMPGHPLSEVFGRANPQAVDLLKGLLVFDPAKRFTVDEALRHPYLRALHDDTDEVPVMTPGGLNADDEFRYEAIADRMSSAAYVLHVMDEVRCSHSAAPVYGDFIEHMSRSSGQTNSGRTASQMYANGASASNRVRRRRAQTVLFPLCLSSSTPLSV